MTEAWKADMPSGRKLVLLSLCDNANDQGECFPSIAMVSKRCSMGERTVQGHLADLEKTGVLRRIERAGRSTIYQIDPRRFCTPAESAPPQNLRLTPAESAPTPPQISRPSPAESAPITIKEPSIEPKGNRQKKIARPDDVSQQVWDDFLALRKAKRATLTATALSGIRNEAGRAGMTLEHALSMCCMRGWQGFKAAWVGDSVQNIGKRPAKPSQMTDEQLSQQRLSDAEKARRLLFGDDQFSDVIDADVLELSHEQK